MQGGVHLFRHPEFVLSASLPPISAECRPRSPKYFISVPARDTERSPEPSAPEEAPNPSPPSPPPDTVEHPLQRRTSSCHGGGDGGRWAHPLGVLPRCTTGGESPMQGGVHLFRHPEFVLSASLPPISAECRPRSPKYFISVPATGHGAESRAKCPRRSPKSFTSIPTTRHGAEGPNTTFVPSSCR